MRSAATGAQVGEADAVGDGDDETLAEGLFEGETVKGETEMLGETLGAVEVGAEVAVAEVAAPPGAKRPRRLGSKDAAS